MMIFNSFTVANDLITILARDNRTAVAFSCRQIKTFEGICLTLRICELSFSFFFCTFLNFFVCYGNKLESHFARNFHEFGVARSEELDVI